MPEHYALGLSQVPETLPQYSPIIGLPLRVDGKPGIYTAAPCREAVEKLYERFCSPIEVVGHYHSGYRGAESLKEPISQGLKGWYLHLLVAYGQTSEKLTFEGLAILKSYRYEGLL